MTTKKLEDPLAAYVKATRMSDAAIGRQIGVNRWKIGRARRGELPLSIAEEVALQEFTGVTPAQWANYRAKLLKARGSSDKGAGQKTGRPFDAETEPEGVL